MSLPDDLITIPEVHAMFRSYRDRRRVIAVAQGYVVDRQTMFSKADIVAIKERMGLKRDG